MFRVQPLCKSMILFVVLLFILLINVTGRDALLIIISAIFFVWVYRHISSLKIVLTKGYIVKETGNTFKRKNIIMLKNISNIQIFILHPLLPAFIRLNTYSQSLYVMGLNGRQRLMLEKYILQLK